MNNVGVRMVITTTPPISFPTASIAQGGMHLKTTVMIPPQQLWLGLSLSLSAVFPVGGYSLALFPPAKLLDTPKKIACAPSPETCLTKRSPPRVFSFKPQWFPLHSGEPGGSLGKGCLLQRPAQEVAEVPCDIASRDTTIFSISFFFFS